jgi:hypothetical protein
MQATLSRTSVLHSIALSWRADRMLRFTQWFSQSSRAPAQSRKTQWPPMILWLLPWAAEWWAAVHALAAEAGWLAAVRLLAVPLTVSAALPRRQEPVWLPLRITRRTLPQGLRIAKAHAAGSAGGNLAARATGMPGVMLRSGASASSAGMLSASKKNVHLDSGTQMELGIVTNARQ